MQKKLRSLLSFILALSILFSCGVNVLGITAKADEAVTTELDKVASWNLSLGDDISANFYVTISDEIAQNAVMNISIGGVKREYPVSTANRDLNGNYIFTADLAAAQMTDTITLQLEAES